MTEDKKLNKVINDFELIKETYKKIANLLHFFSIFTIIELNDKADGYMVAYLKNDVNEYTVTDRLNVFKFCNEIFNTIDFQKLLEIKIDTKFPKQQQDYLKFINTHQNQLGNFLNSNFLEDRQKKSYDEKLQFLFEMLYHSPVSDKYGLFNYFDALLINYPGNYYSDFQIPKSGIDEIDKLRRRGDAFYDKNSLFTNYLSEEAINWSDLNIIDFNHSDYLTTTNKINEIYEPISKKIDLKKPDEALKILNEVEKSIMELKNSNENYDSNQIEEALNYIKSMKDDTEIIAKANNVRIGFITLLFVVTMIMFLGLVV